MSEYNGWTNKPTWLMNIYIDEYGLNNRIRKQVKEIMEDECEPLKIASVYNFIKDEILYTMTEEYDDHVCNDHDDRPSFSNEVLRWGLAMINWHELAQHYFDDYRNSQEWLKEVKSNAESTS